MKSIKTVILMLGILASTFGVGAQTVPPPVIPPVIIPLPASLPMIQRMDTLRNFAFSSVTHGSRGVNSPSMDWDHPGSFTYTNAVGNGAEAVLGKLFAVDFRFWLNNPDDKVTGNVWLYDAFNNLVFYGNVEYPHAVGGLVSPQYSIWIQYIWLLSNVQAAEVLALDEDGVTARHYPVTVTNGHIRFEPGMAGAPNGILAVRSTDGTLVTYLLRNPIAHIPGDTTEGVTAWKIEGHYIYAPAGGPAKVVKIIETGILPTLYIEVLAGEVVTFDVMGLVQMGVGTTFERPPSFSFVQQDGPWSGAGPLSFTPGLPRVTFPATGKYRVQFDWINFGQPGTLYTGPEVPVGGVGEKGGGPG